MDVMVSWDFLKSEEFICLDLLVDAAIVLSSLLNFVFYANLLS
jgi:hypothetical protein